MLSRLHNELDVYSSVCRQEETPDGIRQKIEEMEKKYDYQFTIVFDAIKQLLESPAKPKNL